LTEKLTLKFETRIEELMRLQSEIEQLGEREDWDPALVFHVNLAVEELATNIMNYGHSEGLHEFEVILSSEPDHLTIDIWDDGQPFDPLTEAPEPDLDASLEDRRIGGLGIYFAETLMDEMRYERGDGRNHLTLIKRRV
jgi:anti-sigma regulatory factor (Ser/Thr protein kinase)